MHLDSWGLKAKKLGFRSRAVFKLEEILDKTNALKGCKNVIDIGAAPGGWSQLVKSKLQSSKIFAIDILNIDPIDGVDFYQKRVEDIDSISDIFLLKGFIDLVISDLAPNLTGIGVIDEANIYELNDITLNVAVEYLNKSKGVFIIKTFQNSMFKKLRTKMVSIFDEVQTIKPAASKKQSAEIYLYGAFKK
jgi:23S rRNA (uridine2552-2'-O)-methyltransferase|tara:strand:- start:3048 stop:3620 length:573 start_codon:yes stop_codon:yes gene_type:complete